MSDIKQTEVIRRRYFEWIYRLVLGATVHDKEMFKEILRVIHNITFWYTIPMDGNREADGINLRYRFGYEEDIPDYIIAKTLDTVPCSVLEMMAALCLRYEEQIAGKDPFNNNYIPSGMFLNMLVSMGILKPNANIEEAIARCLDRNYSPNGDGGLFTVSRNVDMRSVEIWYQMMYWLEENSL